MTFSMFIYSLFITDEKASFAISDRSDHKKPRLIRQSADLFEDNISGKKINLPQG